jgi:8-oxo-dGTP diphosphatase
VIRGERVLAARRSAPAELAGGWEFPGGKLEADETPAAAVVRECREELGVEVVVLGQLGVASSATIELQLWAVRLPAGEPVPLQDHDEVRWLAQAELDAVDWLPIDRVLLPSVRRLL